MDENCASRKREEWRPVVGFEGIYEVSEAGTIRRVAVTWRGTTVGKVLKWYVAKNGYAQVSLMKDAARRVLYVHAIVAAAFIGECPDGFEVNHIDTNRSNNHRLNLEYVTHLGNCQHMVALGRSTFGEKNPQAVLTEQQVLEIRSLGHRMSQSALGRRYGVNPATIALILHRRTWRHL